MLKLLRKKPAVSLPKLIIYKIVYVVIHFVIIIVSYLALIGLLLVDIGFYQIKRKYIIIIIIIIIVIIIITLFFCWLSHNYYNIM